QDIYKNMAQANENPYSKAMGDFLEMQKNYMDLMTPKTASDGTKTSFDPFNPSFFDSGMFEQFMNFQKNYMNFISNFMQQNPNFPKMPFPFMDMSQWSESQKSMNEYFDKFKQYYNPLEIGKTFSPAAKDLFEKMMNANTYYLNMYQLWRELEHSNIKPTIDEIKKFSSTLIEKYDPIFKDMIIPLLPQEFQPLMKNSFDLFKTYIDTNIGFYTPWTNNYSNLRDLFVEGMLDDKTKLGSFFELWREQFDKTFGAVLLSPSVGINKELIEQQNKTFDTYIDMLLLGIDFTTRILAVQNEHIDDIIRKYFEMAEKGSQPKSFSEFYKYWTTELERILESYFATPEYSNLLGQISSVAMDYKIEMQKLTEKYLEETPLVTRSEMDSLYKTIYDLKKEVRGFKKSQKQTRSQSKSDEEDNV
ncbi:MAG: poly(R)-hydroxyalkanoic acid synthase subunit PhaE, partial [Filifactor alocis]|nr:poly(R)-hydroxyalkanoic acid synthase subunit PhaE [Filifactor alocis]